MQKVRNIVFVLVACALAFCCIGHKVAGSALHVVDLPAKSALEGREYQKLPELSVESVSSGEFQSEFEQYMADLVPNRDRVLLTNAAVQRAGIRSASTVFGYDVMPTFYGSDYVLSEDKNSVYGPTAVRSSYPKKKLRLIADRYSSLISRNEGVNWYICMPNRAAASDKNPAFCLRSQAVGYQWFDRNLLSRIKGATIIDGKESDEGELSDSYFRTDHHWNIYAAVDTYQTVMQNLGRQTVEIQGYSKVLDDWFYGSAARSGLCSLDEDEVYDVIYEKGPINAQVGGQDLECPSVTGSAYQKSSKYADVYGEYFHHNYAMLCYYNPAGKGKLLIIGDSFTNCIDRLFAESYEEVHVYDPRYSSESVQSLLEKTEYTDALVLMSYSALTSDEMLRALK